MFEVTPDDIAKLDDSALSALVIRLCEMELIKRGLPTSSLITGGAQDAPDGGVDLMVEAPDQIADSGYIPRGRTIFQIKATPMPPRTLAKEMRPKGDLRPAIGNVLSAGGAYVIACSKTSPAGVGLERVRSLMRDAAGPVITDQALVDFLGPDRLALWCRMHPAVMSWARLQAGRPLEGWLPFENWSKPSEGTGPEFILDEDARLIDESSPQDGALSIRDGLDRMRAMAMTSSSPIRLIGLSGVGKTRLVQALFDPRVGTNPLPEQQALYCDFGQPVSPSPNEVARQLVARGDKVVLIVDNCSPEVHRALAGITASSKVSLISVEYDVRDDDMEGTEVFRLEPASDEVTVRLIERRFQHINLSDRERIAAIAGGNARIAMALAHTVRQGESLGRLRDDGLFDRLFEQRKQPDPTLLATAEVAALVYSFDAENHAADSEMAALASLAEQSTVSFKSGVVELARRDLVQQRSQWRAILPHAVANRLAARALERLDLTQVTRTLEANGERLLRSFSRRLAFLHDIAAAQRLAEAWFSDEGRLGRVETLGEFDFSLFKNLAPLAPEAALDAIVRGAERDPAWSGFRSGWGSGRDRYELCRLLRALAFETHMFEPAVSCLANIILRETENERQPSRPILEGLFKLYLSGTLAPPEQRLSFVRSLFETDEPERAKLGLDLLDAMLESHWFGATDSFDFGARPRTFGWQPKTAAEVQAWFKPALAFLREQILAGNLRAEPAKKIFADRFRQLWWNTGLQPELAESMALAAAGGFWPEGWIATRATLKYAEAGADTSNLQSLEERLRPSNLLEKARAYGFSKGYGSLDVDEFDDGSQDDEKPSSRWDRVEAYTKEIAKAVATDDDVRAELLPDLVRSGVQRPWSFGEGLACGTSAPEVIWDELVQSIRAAPLDDAEPAILRSFLRAWSMRDEDAVEARLDVVLRDPLLGRWFPFLQTAIHPLNEAAKARIRLSFNLGLTSGWSYQSLAYGRVPDQFSPVEFAALIAGIAELEQGDGCALHLFHMRLFSDREEESVDPEIQTAGRELLLRYPFGLKRHQEDTRLAEIVDACLAGRENAATATRLLRRLKVAVSRYGAYGHQFDDFVESIFRVQPQAALDFFLDRQFRPRQGRYAQSLLYQFDFTTRPITAVSEMDLLTWAARDPGERHRRVAANIPLFVGKEPDPMEDADRLWPTALALLDAAPNTEEVLAELEEHIRPMSWSGSLADILDRRRSGLKKLDSHANPIVRAWSQRWQSILAKRAIQERKQETHRQQSFE